MEVLWTDRGPAPRGDPVVLFDGPATGARAGLVALDAHADASVGLSIAQVAVDGGPGAGALQVLAD